MVDFFFEENGVWGKIGCFSYIIAFLMVYLSLNFTHIHINCIYFIPYKI